MKVIEKLKTDDESKARSDGVYYTPETENCCGVLYIKSYGKLVAVYLHQPPNEPFSATLELPLPVEAQWVTSITIDVTGDE